MSPILDCLKKFPPCAWQLLCRSGVRSVLKTPEASRQTRLLPLHPIPAADLLTFQLASQVRCDPQFGGLPETMYLPGDPSLVWAAGCDGILVDLLYP